MNNQFKVFLKHFADENKQRNTITIPRLKVLERQRNSIRSGGSGSAIGTVSPTSTVCPNELATAMKSLSRMMGMQIK